MDLTSGSPWSEATGRRTSLECYDGGFLDPGEASGITHTELMHVPTGHSSSLLATAVPAGSTPTVQVTPQLETKSIGASVEFHCAVPSDQGTQLRWFKEGGQLPPGHSVQDGVLR